MWGMLIILLAAVTMIFALVRRIFFLMDIIERQKRIIEFKRGQVAELRKKQEPWLNTAEVPESKWEIKDI